MINFSEKRLPRLTHLGLIVGGICLTAHVGTALSQTPEIGGFVEIDHLSYLRNQPAPKVNSRNQAILELKLSGAMGDQASFFAETELRDDQSDSRRNRIFLKEAYLNLYAGSMDFRLGKQIIPWGKADYVNPTDNISPWDYSDFLDTDNEQLGVFALKSAYYSGNFTLEGIVVPTLEISTLPPVESRWFPPLPESIANPAFPFSGPPTLPAKFVFEPAALPDQSLGNAQFAAKASWSAAGWDVSLSGYTGWNDLPDYHRSQQSDSGRVQIRMQPVYHRLKALGGDFATTFASWSVRGEAAYFFTADPAGKDPEIDDPYFQYVLALDRNFRPLGSRNLFLLLQWVQEIPRYGFSAEGVDLRHVFQRSLLGKIEYEPGDRTKVGIEGAYNFRHGDYFMRPYWRAELADAVVLRISADILGGSSSGFFGVYGENDRLQARLKYSF